MVIKKKIAYFLFCFSIIGNFTFFIIVKNNPIEKIKKEVLMIDNELIKNDNNKENLLISKEFEILNLINLSKKFIENQYKVELSNSNASRYENIGRIKESFDKTGIAKISWNINEIQNTKYTYVVVINVLGEVLYSEIIESNM